MSANCKCRRSARLWLARALVLYAQQRVRAHPCVCKPTQLVKECLSLQYYSFLGLLDNKKVGYSFLGLLDKKRLESNSLGPN